MSRERSANDKGKTLVSKRLARILNLNLISCCISVQPSCCLTFGAKHVTLLAYVAANLTPTRQRPYAELWSTSPKPQSTFTFSKAGFHRSLPWRQENGKASKCLQQHAPVLPPRTAVALLTCHKTEKQKEMLPPIYLADTFSPRILR